MNSLKIVLYISYHDLRIWHISFGTLENNCLLIAINSLKIVLHR
jgi:hypothetical protein